MKLILLLALLPMFDACIYNFASKTNYNDSLKLDKEKQFFPPLQPETCTCSSYVVSLYRHGTRYPSDKHMRKVRSIFQRLKPINENGQKRLSNLNKTLEGLSEQKEKMLAARGFLELEEIGRKLKHEHQNLFAEYRDKYFQYYVTSKNRTVDSFKGFYKGIQGNNTIPTPIEDNKLLRFHKYCQKYIKEVTENSTALEEYNKFMQQQQAYINDQLYNNYKTFFERINMSIGKLCHIFAIKN